MRKAIFIIIALCFAVPATLPAQQGLDIVKKAYRKMLTLNAVEWDTEWKWKPLSDDDTSVTTGHVQFARLGGENFIVRSVNETWNNEKILVPDTLLWIHHKDSSANLYLKNDWEEYPFLRNFLDNLVADVITNLRYQHTFRTDLSHHYALAMKAYNDEDEEYEEIFKETDNEWDIQLNGEIDTIRLVIRKWDNMITLGHHYMEYEEETQSYLYTFDNYSYDPQIPTIQQRLAELPDYYTVDYKFPPKPDSLDLGSPVDWTGRYFEGDTVTSADFKGKWALYKFTYRSCGWCQKAVPMTNEIIERFPDLAVVGLDPYDHDKPEKLREHIEKREIEYPIILISRDDAKRLKVDGYPKFYLVNPEGKLVWFCDGYPRDREDETIEEIATILANGDS